jgi:hypothetical protein
MRPPSALKALVFTIGLILFPTSASAAPVYWDNGCTSSSNCNATVNTGTGGGLYSLSQTGDAILGDTDSGIGVVGEATSGIGVYGVTSGSSRSGVKGEVSGTSSSGVYGRSTGSSYAGVYGSSEANGFGVYGLTLGSSNGVRGVNGNTTSNGPAAVEATSGSSSAGLAFYGTGGIKLSSSFAEKASGPVWSAPSDARLKKDVSDYLTGLAAIRQIRPVRYKYNGLGGTDDTGVQYVGVIAQELEVVQPSMVSIDRRKLSPNDTEETDIRRVDPSDFLYMLINAVKEQQATIESQNARIAALEAAMGMGGGKGASLGGQGGMLGLAGVMVAGAVYVSSSRRKKREDAEK